MTQEERIKGLEVKIAELEKKITKKRKFFSGYLFFMPIIVYLGMEIGLPLFSGGPLFKATKTTVEMASYLFKQNQLSDCCSFEYKKFSEIDWTKNKVSSGLEWAAKEIYSPLNQIKLRDPEKFKTAVYKKTELLGFGKGRIKELSPQELIKLSLGILLEKLDYAKVDEDEFREVYPVRATIDEYLKDGLGDCDKYTDGLRAVFEELKKVNRKAENIYVTKLDSTLSSRQKHSVAAALVLGDNRIQYAHIDATNLDDGRELTRENIDYGGELASDPTLNLSLMELLNREIIFHPYIKKEFLRIFNKIKSLDMASPDKAYLYKRIVNNIAIYYNNSPEEIDIAERCLWEYHDFIVSNKEFRYPEGIIEARARIKEAREKISYSEPSKYPFDPRYKLSDTDRAITWKRETVMDHYKKTTPKVLPGSGNKFIIK